MKRKIISMMLSVMMFGMLTGCSLIGSSELPTTSLPTIADDEPVSVVQPGEESEKIRIGIAQMGTDEDSNNIYAGFDQAMSESLYVEDMELDYNVAESLEDCMRIADRMVTGGCDVIFVIGEDAARAAKNRTQDIPIIVAGVEDLRVAGFVKDDSAPGGNMSGVSSKISQDVHVGLIMKYYPLATKVNILYSNNAASRYQIEEFAASCYGAGLQVNYIQVMKSEDIRSALLANVETKKSTDAVESTEKTEAPEVTDVVYAPMDDIVFANMADAAGVCNDNKRPFFTNNEDMVTYGALASCTVDYTNMGKRAAGMVIKLIEGAVDISKMPVEYVSTDECTVNINTTTAELIEFEVPTEEATQAQN